MLTDNPSYNRKFKDDFRKNTKQTILIKPNKPKETGWDGLGKWLRNLFDGNQDGFWAGFFFKIFGFWF